ncbi:two-component system response regulator [Geobacter sp. SVR]|uniref:response regulator n=1 Tax=Geobacter sp. SVR TaxID=2495594 RepID=UPI00143F034F|nr:two-component system response regulator [Geobacter sp. SVR]BCS52040.1 two-component system response regulator [Geobacter sp. SVR]GCF86495.1 two-component system response regulator [Geobacter sp. SVR]
MGKQHKQTILIVDDIPANIDILSSILRQEYALKAASNGRKALEIAASAAPPDLILLDVLMPEMDGFEVCRRLKENPLTRRIPVIFVTARDEIEDEAAGFACGAVDYIGKPVSPSIVQARVRTHLALYDQNRALEDKVRERMAELNDTRLQIIRRLGRAAEYKDNETGMHVIRMSRYSQLISQEYGLSHGEAELVLHAAPMHDVGKIGIPDRILLKPAKLDDKEWSIMRAHSYIGYRIIGDHPGELLKAAAIAAYTHHEKWDGSGYPRRLKHEDIPLIGRIIAVADVFDALTSVRPYKAAWPVEEAVTEIRRCSGSHFDPALVEAFTRRMPEILEVKQQFADVTAEAPFAPDDAL